jgi:hypothetical protein
MVTGTASKPPQDEQESQQTGSAEQERETERVQKEAAEERKDERGYQ